MEGDLPHQVCARAGGKSPIGVAFGILWNGRRRPRRRRDPKTAWRCGFHEQQHIVLSIVASHPDKTLTSLQFGLVSPIMSAMILYMWRPAGRKTN